MHEDAIRDLVRVWYEKRARREDDPISKFVFLWFCFNAWLAFESDEDVDARMLSWLKGSDGKRSRLRAAYNTARASSAFEDQLQTLASYCPIRSNRPGKPDVSISSVDDFQSIVDAIYRVRCNLFHGTKSADDNRDYKLVKVCSLILHKWIGNLLVTFRLDP
jgi:hypothetical protein